MNKHIVTFLLAALLLLPACAQKKYGMYAIAFYNQENLFDTINDPHINDEDFLPGGSYGWNSMKYRAKVKNMSTVLAEIGTDKGLKQGAAIIGLSEVENRAVVEDLVKSEALRSRGYRILHFDSPDRRGIDCAMLYNPKAFTLEDSLYVPYIYPSPQNPKDNLGFRVEAGRIQARPLFGDTTHITRGFLVGIGKLAGEQMAVIVNHWPSRGAESYVRERAGRQVKALSEALFQCYPGIKIVIMGDLNDDPDNKSMTQALGCIYKPQEVKKPTDLYNPWLYMLRTVGQGTLLYNGKWNLFDQIVISGSMVDTKTRHGKKPKVSDLDLKNGLTLYMNEVFIRDYMVQQEGKYKGGPKRTTSGGVWQNGYSDHFPTCIYLVKEQ